MLSMMSLPFELSFQNTESLKLLIRYTAHVMRRHYEYYLVCIRQSVCDAVAVVFIQIKFDSARDFI